MKRFLLRTFIVHCKEEKYEENLLIFKYIDVINNSNAIAEAWHCFYTQV